MSALKWKHPGELVREEFFVPLGLSAAEVARASGISQPTLCQVLNGRRPFTPETALRLGRFFEVDARWFINLQSQHDLRIAEKRLASELKRLRPRGGPALT